MESEIKNIILSSISKKILFICPYCLSTDVTIGDIFISRKQSILVNDNELKIKTDDNKENAVGFELCCASHDCPNIHFSFVRNEEGLSIDFSNLGNIEQMKHQYIISEKMSGLVEFVHKTNGEVIRLKRNGTLGTWVLTSDNIKIKAKEVDNSNSNFFNLYHEAVVKGIQVTRWLRSNANDKTQIKLFVCRTKDGTEKFFWRYRVKENDKWIKSKDNIFLYQQPLLQQIKNAWSSGRTDNVETLTKTLL